MASKNQKLSKKRGKEHNPAPLSKLDVYRELEAIKKRVSNVKMIWQCVCSFAKEFSYSYICDQINNNSVVS